MAWTFLRHMWCPFRFLLKHLEIMSVVIRRYAKMTFGPDGGLELGQ